MEFRYQCSTLEESMGTIIEVENLSELMNELSKEHGDLSQKHIKVEYHCFDDRINWDSYIITINGDVIGFTNGPIT